MHEAALATVVAKRIREDALSGIPITLLVSGGHADADAFDAALRLHLGAADPGLDLALVSIVHVPHELMCLTCGRPFAGVGQTADCPRCGGVGLARPIAESIEVVCVEPAAAGDGDGSR